MSVRNINICGRILPQFTGLLRTNTVAAKRDLLAERTGLGKSVSVLLCKNRPQKAGWVLVDTFQLSGSRKICISLGNLEDENGKTKSWRNTYRGVDLKKMRFVPGDSLVPIHQLLVPDGKLWMGTKEILLVYQNINSNSSCLRNLDVTYSSKHRVQPIGFYKLVRPIVFYSTSNSIKTRLIKWIDLPTGSGSAD